MNAALILFLLYYLHMPEWVLIFGAVNLFFSLLDTVRYWLKWDEG